MKKVSVIMATYKTEPLIFNEALQSILNQTYENLELIVVCDGDIGEYNRVKKDYNLNPKIKILLNKENMGLPYSLNRAINETTGEYIARMDSDDICIRDRIATQVDFLERNPDIGMCGMFAKLFGDVIGKKVLYLNNIEQIKIQLLYRATLIHPTVMIRRNIMKSYKYDENFMCSQDFELWSRLVENTQIAIIPKVGIKYRIHEKQVSTAKKNQQLEAAKKIIKRNSQKINNRDDDRIYETLLVLGGKNKLTRENYRKISKNIDYIIDENKKYTKYDTKEMKKVLYNRFFELTIKNRIIPLKINEINKVLKWYNFKELYSRL